MTRILRRILAPLAFAGTVAAVLLLLDGNLANRVTASVEEARSALAESPVAVRAGSSAAESSGYRMTGVAADLCSALTGTISGSWMLPRTRRVMRDNPFQVRVEGDRCRRGSSSHVLHFTAPQDAPPAPRAPSPG